MQEDVEGSPEYEEENKHQGFHPMRGLPRSQGPLHGVSVRSKLLLGLSILLVSKGV